MKRWISLALILLVFSGLFTCCARRQLAQPQVVQMRAICELATMDCYYHNVAKYKEENAEHFLWIKKDKYFWIEYEGVVSVGIDASLVTMEVSGELVTITIPPAQVLGCRVEDSTLTEDSFIVDKDSAAVTAQDQQEAFREAQEHMELTAASDTALLANAQQRAKTLLENYVRNIGVYTGVNYQITWTYVDGEGNPMGESPVQTAVPQENTQ